MMPLPPRYLQPVPLPTPFRPGDPRHLDPLGLHVRDTTDPHKVRDRLVDIGVLRKNGDGTYSPYLPTKADLVNGKVPASQLPEDQHGVTQVLVDGVSVVTGGTASISLAGKVDKEQGKGLSSNDYTTEEKAKLSGIEAGAQKNVGEVYTYAEKTKLSGIEAGAQKNIAPVAPSTDPSAGGKPADAKATGDALAGKQPIISDLATIRSGASAGATAYQKPASGIPATDMAASVQTSLGKADTALQSAPVQSVNGKTGAVSLTASGVGAAPVADLRYVLPAGPLDPDTETGEYALNDRTANWIFTDSTSVTIVLPPPILGRLRDFELYVTSVSSGTGNVSLTCDAYDASEIITIGNGAGAVPDIPLGGDTVLYFSEVKEGYFILKGEEFKTIAQGGN